MTRRDLAYFGAVTDKDMKALRSVERVYRDTEVALVKVAATDEERVKILASLARWCPRPNADALAAEAAQWAASYEAFYQGKNVPFKFWSHS